MGACEAPSSFCFNCCKVDNACLCGQMVSMIFICKSIPSSTKFFVSMTFNHSITEFWISYESIMDSMEILFLASFLQLVSRKVFPVSRLFTISMSMRSSFLDALVFFGLLPALTVRFLRRTPGRTPFHPKQTLFLGVTFLRAHPLPATPFQCPRSRTAALGEGAAATYLPLRWPDCTSSRLRAEEFSRIRSRKT